MMEIFALKYTFVPNLTITTSTADNFESDLIENGWGIWDAEKEF